MEKSSIKPASSGSSSTYNHGRLPALVSSPIASHSRPTSGDSQSLQLPPKRVQVIAACEPCRLRKAKCSAGRPKCKRCLKLNLDCQYRTEEAETPNRALKRKVHEFQHKSDQADELVGLLRSRSASQSREMLERLRSGQSVKDVLNVFRDDNLLLLPTDLPQADLKLTFPLVPGYVLPEQGLYEIWLQRAATPGDLVRRQQVQSLRSNQSASASPSQANEKMQPYSTAKIEDARLGRINASRWTNVTSDNLLVAELLAMYIQYEHPSRQMINIDDFLDDMVAERENFCSQLLVNSVLTTACHAINRFENRHQYWNRSNPAYGFLAEARRLWDVEMDVDKLTTVQASLVLTVLYHGDGLTRVGERFQEHSLQMAARMGLFSSATSSDPEWLASLSATAWGAFCWQATHAFSCKAAPSIKHPPALPLPEFVNKTYSDGEVWLRYPNSTEATSLNILLIFEANAYLHVIINEISELCFASGSSKVYKMSLENLAGVYEKLQNWFEGLPEVLQAVNIELPCHLRLHLHYYSILIDLFSTLAKSKEHSDAIFVPVSSISPTASSTITKSTPFSFNPQAIVTNSIACSHSLLRIYYLRHGFASYDSKLVAALQQISSLALDNPSSPSALFHLALGLKGLFDQGKNLQVSRALFENMYEQGLATGEQGKKVLEDFIGSGYEDVVLGDLAKEHFQDARAEKIDEHAQFSFSNVPRDLLSDLKLSGREILVNKGKMMQEEDIDM